jgi:S1-C subfamily serine protease
VPGDLLDLILLALVAAFAVAGYRQGFIIGVLSLVGFVGGVAAGALIAPKLSRAVGHSAPWQAFVAILVVFTVAVMGMLLASGIGVAVRSRLTGRPATFLDSVGGAAVNVVAVLLVAWLIGSFVVEGQFPAVSRQVSNSVVLRTVDGLMPKGLLYLPFFPDLRNLLASGIDTPVFGAFGAEGSLNLAPPSPSVLSSPAVLKIEQSVVKIEGVAQTCSLRIEGSGFVISHDHVLTNAHVVAGVNQGPEVLTRQGQALAARVVLYDPLRDIAVLDVPGLNAPPLKFAGPASYGANAIVAGYPLNHSLTLTPARVGRRIIAYGPDIYQNTTVHRYIYPIRALVERGNSGGPLMSTAGKVYGVVFAASTSYQDTGYALTAGEIASDVAAGKQDYSPVSTEQCQTQG